MNAMSVRAEPAASRAEVIERVRACRPLLRELEVEGIALFGSAARDSLETASDIDILVRFKGRSTFDAFMGVKLALEDALGRRVDLVTPAALKPGLARRIAAELVDVA